MNSVENVARDTNTAPKSPAGGSLSIRNIRVAEALARFSGDKERYQHWLLEFVGHGPSAVMQIRQAINNGSVETAINLVHALKGRTGMLGMSELHSISLSLEMSLKNGEPTHYWLEELECSVNEISRDIAAALGEHNI